jgi:hypothetical protein
VVVAVGELFRQRLEVEPVPVGHTPDERALRRADDEGVAIAGDGCAHEFDQLPLEGVGGAGVDVDTGFPIFEAELVHRRRG